MSSNVVVRYPGSDPKSRGVEPDSTGTALGAMILAGRDREQGNVDLLVFIQKMEEIERESKMQIFTNGWIGGDQLARCYFHLLVRRLSISAFHLLL